MNNEKPKSAKEVEEALDDIKQRADRLEKQIQDAETKHPPRSTIPTMAG